LPRFVRPTKADQSRKQSKEQSKTKKLNRFIMITKKFTYLKLVRLLALNCIVCISKKFYLLSSYSLKEIKVFSTFFDNLKLKGSEKTDILAFQEPFTTDGLLLVTAKHEVQILNELITLLQRHKHKQK
jgi:hypothetical protein